MHALREELPVEDDLTRLEPRVARIEGEFIQLNSRLAGVEVDLRDFRKSVDSKLDKLADGMDSKLKGELKVLVERLDARFEKQDAKLEAVIEKLYDRIDRVDRKFEGKLEALSTRHFSLWLTVTSSAATIAAAVLAIILGTPHSH